MNLIWRRSVKYLQGESGATDGQHLACHRLRLRKMAWAVKKKGNFDHHKAMSFQDIAFVLAHQLLFTC